MYSFSGEIPNNVRNFLLSDGHMYNSYFDTWHVSNAILSYFKPFGCKFVVFRSYSKKKFIHPAEVVPQIKSPDIYKRNVKRF
jgi:hypothetical protein